MKKILFILAMTAFVSSCTQPEVGYISDNIHSLQDTITVPRGIFYSSPPPAIEGSTYPIEWSITGITDQSGQLTTELQDKYDILIWKAPFDPNTDTTLEIASKKLELSKEPIIIMNNVSGQFVFTQASKFATNDNFDVSVKASNIKGEKLLDKFTHITLAPFKPVEILVGMRSRLNLVNSAGGKTALYTSEILNDEDPQAPSVLDGTHPYITIVKISDEPKLAVKVKMIFTDSYDVVLDPSKVIFFPDGSSYLQNFHDNTIGTVVDAEGTTFSLPAPPFPQYGRTYADGPLSYLMYYLSSNDAFIVDKEAYEANPKNPAVDWAQFTDADGNIRNNAYLRWGFRLNDTGTWQIKMRVPYSKVRK